MDKFVSFAIDIDGAISDVEILTTSEQYITPDFVASMESAFKKAGFDIRRSMFDTNSKHIPWNPVFWEYTKKCIQLLSSAQEYRLLRNIIRASFYKGRKENVSNTHRKIGIHSSSIQSLISNTATLRTK